MQIVKAPPGGGRNCTWDLPDEIKDLMGLATNGGNPSAPEATLDPTEVESLEQMADSLTLTDEDLNGLLGDQS
jgi:hypothetical protein